MIVYANSFSAPFHYDDFHFLKENINIKSLKTFYDWLLNDYANFLKGRPLLLLSFFLNYKIGGLDTFTYHLFNLIIHIAASYIFYLLFKRYAELHNDNSHSVKLILGAAIFIIHPINTESVTYISSRSSILSTLFVLISMLSFFRATTKGFSIFSYICSVLFFVSGFMVKETVIVLPALLILFDYYFVSEDLRGLRSRIKFHLPFILIFLAGIFFYFGYFTSPEAKRPLMTHLLTECKVFVKYIQLSILPIGQNIDHDIIPSVTFDHKALLSLTALVILIMFSILIKEKNRVISFAILWFFITLSPFLVIRLNDYMAERWLYLPMIGFSLFAGESLNIFIKRKRKLGIIFIAVVIFIFGGLAIARNNVYKSQVLLWEDASRKSPDKYRPYSNLSRAYKEIGDLDKAIENGIKSIEKGGIIVEAYINLASAYEEQGNYKKAAETLLAVEKYASIYFAFHQNLGAAYMKMGEYKKALDAFQRALSIQPNSPLILFSIGTTYENMDNDAKAREFFMLATRALPQNAQDYMSRGISFFKLGDNKQALSDFIGAVRTDPLDVNVRIFLANNYLGNGYYDNAYKHFSAASRISPNFAPAYKGMGLAMTGKGNKKEAVVLFRKALSLLPPDSPERKEIEALINTTRN